MDAPFWHLFWIDMHDLHRKRLRSRGFLVSALSASTGKAEELARASLIDEQGGQVVACEYLGPCDGDVCRPAVYLVARELRLLAALRRLRDVVARMNADHLPSDDVREVTDTEYGEAMGHAAHAIDATLGELS